MAGLYQYSPLSRPRCTRVIKLLPSRRDEAPMELELREMLLDQPVEYRALSYCWGGQGLDQPVSCDGKRLLITKNASAALRRLRRSFQACYIWIDAICIDQSSNEDKNVQVPLMADIYTKASGVAVWLGEGNADTEKAFKFMHNVRRVGRAKARLIYTWKIRPSIAQRTTVLKDEKVPFEAGIRQLSDDNAYWTRVWTLQEIALNPACEIYCGSSSSISFDAFVKGLDFVDEYLGPDAKEGSQSASGEYARTCLMHLFSQRKQHAQDRNIMFAALLEKAATNPRDLIYGMAAIYPGIFGTLHVDYGYDVSTVFTQAAAAMIKGHDAVLPLLYYACASRKSYELPSWVPDWTSLTEELDRLPQDTMKQLYKKPIFRFSDDCFKLYLKGFIVDPDIRIISEPIRSLPNSGESDQAWLKKVSDQLLGWLTSHIDLMKKDATTVASLLEVHGPIPIPRNVTESGLYAETALLSFLWPGINLEYHLLPWLEGQKWEGSPPPQISSLEHDIRTFAGQTMFMTSQGYIGCCREVRAGDLLVYLTGAVAPFVMRKAGASEYRLVSYVELREVYTQSLPDLQAESLEEFCIM